MSLPFQIQQGSAYPLGSLAKKNGVNFSIFSQNATQVILCIFLPNKEKPSWEIPLDPKLHKTGNIWHIFLKNIDLDCTYGYKLQGPYSPKKGHLFSPNTIVSDPYAKALCSHKKWGSFQHAFYKSKITTLEPFDWEKTSKPDRPIEDLIIYEMHVRGFTIDPSSKVLHPGTFLGIIEKIPYLKKLGVNAIELLPIFSFNELLNTSSEKAPSYNYWGYSPINFFALMDPYASAKEDTSAIFQFKTLVKELHKNEIEVILDVVYNHTAEGSNKNYFINFRGIDNSIYYLLDKAGNYQNFSGCGNTFNCNHIVCRNYILDSLRYWVEEMKVDGFRFDLASILTRDTKGIPIDLPPLIESISLDPIFANTKLIAEAWDCAGLYQVGSFPSWGKWMEWNGKFRDSVRKIVRGDIYEQGNFSTYYLGSKPLYGEDRTPCHSINFITAHDGFTLKDLVSYNTKHNMSNKENNNDGTPENFSYNHGHEGDTSDTKIKKIRMRQIKNFFLILLTSEGTPMLHMGDEYGHSKQGNNNTWAHDTRINWFQWDKIQENKEIFRFVSSLIQFRKTHPCLGNKNYLTEDFLQWHSSSFEHVNWDHPDGLLALTRKNNKNHLLYIAFNFTNKSASFLLPKYFPEKPWYRRIDTSLSSPDDFHESLSVKIQDNYTLVHHSCIVLEKFP